MGWDWDFGHMRYGDIWFVGLRSVCHALGYSVFIFWTGGDIEKRFISRFNGRPFQLTMRPKSRQPIFFSFAF